MLAGTRQQQTTSAHLPADEREFGAYAAMLHGGRSFDSLLKEIAMTGQMARAVRFDRYGGRDVLYVADVEIPSPAPARRASESGRCTRCSRRRFRPAKAATSPASLPP